MRGIPLLRKGYGLANMELPICLSTHTQMRVGSVSKQFTALAYLLLCEDGKASIDDRLGKYFPKFSPVAQQLPIKLLLGHTSGLRDAADMRFRLGGLEGRPVTTAEILSLYEEIDDLDAEPGTDWIYNNGAFMVLSTLVETLAERPFGEFLKDRVFSPLGMYDTEVRRWDTDFGSNCATPHTLVSKDRFEKRYWGIEFGGAGSLSSSVDDLLRWLKHMDSPTVGSLKTWALMLTPQSLASGVSTGYACGLIRSRYRGVDIICHGGGWIGGNAQVLKVPSVGLDIVVISNRSDAFAPVLGNRILDLCIPNLDPLPATSHGPPKSEGFSLFRVAADDPQGGSGSPTAERPGAALLIGTYRSASGRVVQLFPKDGRQIVSVDAHDLPYDFIEEKKLVPIPIWSHVRRFIELSGDPQHSTAIRLNDFGNVEELSRVHVPDNAEWNRLAGEYRADVGCAVARILHTAGELTMTTECKFGRAEYAVSVLCERTCRIRFASSGFLDAILVFNEDYSEFHLTSYNVRRLRFARAG